MKHFRFLGEKINFELFISIYYLTFFIKETSDNKNVRGKSEKD